MVADHMTGLIFGGKAQRKAQHGEKWKAFIDALESNEELVSVVERLVSDVERETGFEPATLSLGS